jgi:NarL family two-component system response regulator LiaR
LFRVAIRDVIDTEPRFRVIGEAKDGQEAIELCRLQRPDLVLMDARMRRVNGFEATRTIKEELPKTKVLIVTMFYDDTPVFVSEAVRSGADGYVLKLSPIQQLLDSMRGVLRGATQYP